MTDGVYSAYRGRKNSEAAPLVVKYKVTKPNRAEHLSNE